MQNNREIITLQLGDYANHVATHFWNIEWENAQLDSHYDDNKDNDDDDDKDSFKASDMHTTNPYKSAQYKRLKQRSIPSASKHRGTESHRNLNPNICFHSNIQTNNEMVYTPRTIIFAAQGSEGDITSNVYDASPNESQGSHNSNISTWNNEINIVHQSCQEKTSVSKNKNVGNKSECNFWSDYLLPKLHDKSLFLLDGIHHFSTPFYSYATGYDVLNSSTSSSSDVSEDIDDRLRWWVETCDWFQGFQVFASSYDALSGFIPSLMTKIADDYSSKCALLYDISPSASTKRKRGTIDNNGKACASEASRLVMNERFKMNSIICQSQVWNQVSNIIPISVDFWMRRSHLNNQFYNTSIIGSCLHHYTSAVRLNHSAMRLMDVINCMVRRPSMKMSMLSSCSSHLDIDMNFQAIHCIEKLLMKGKKGKKQGFFQRLSCLGPIKNECFSNDSDRDMNIFGEYSCLNGSDVYKTSPQVIEEWKQNKMILAQKQGSYASSSKQDSCDEWKYEMEREKYHLKLMTKLASKAQTPLKWHLVNRSWRLPCTHPFYIGDTAAADDTENNGGDTVSENNKYSIWSSGWSSSLIGDTYLTNCAQNMSNLIKYGNAQKIFGDVELDLTQYNEELISFAQTYSGKHDLDND